MNERLLQFIWQFQYFNKKELRLFSGEELAIIHPGDYNSNQGPDFSQARIRIDQTLLAGTVELHIKTSDWIKHKHDHDSNYRNVILHVVWLHDIPEHSMPLLILQNRISALLLNQYDQWMQLPGFIPCNNSIKLINELVWNSWKQRLLAERLSKKSERIKELLEQNRYHWEETFWWMLARNFGVKINADAFENIARSIPISLLHKIKNRLHQVEAILFGQAGLLSRDFEEDYPNMLKKEFQFLQKKHKLIAANAPVFFLRMRPVNFPTIRLAQLAMLIHTQSNLFSRIKEIDTLNDLKTLLNVCANDYWHYHYVFDTTSVYQPKQLGDQIIGSIIGNAICPFLFCYGQFVNDEIYMKRALQWLEELPPEWNRITTGFTKIDVLNQNAADSQSLIELKTAYCDEKRCLDCAVGNAILGKSGRR